MFNPTTENLWQEIQAAVAETNQHVERCDDIIRRMCGKWYRTDNSQVAEMPENYGYAFMSNMLPQLGADNPGVEIDAARVVGHKTVAQAMKDGLEAWVRDQRFAERHEPVHVDFLVSRGVTLHFLDEDARFSRGTVTPRCKRIAPAQFFADALADGPETDEFRGHWYWVDVDDLIEDENLTDEAREKIVAAAETGGGGEAGGMGRHSANPQSNFTKPSAEGLGRRRLKCYSVWIRATNKIRVVAETSQVVELYEEREYYGPQTGPYQLYDAYPVPGQHWPLSPMVAVEDQNQDLNTHARAMSRAAQRRKSVGLVEANNPDYAEKITSADDGEIKLVKGITGQHVVIEVGGVTQEAYAYTEYARNRLDRISGLTATVQGSVGDAKTATEAKIADDALSNRVVYLKRRVLTATEASLWRIGWYLFHTEGVVIPVNRRDPYTGELMEGLFFGGPSPTDAGATWDDFDVRVRVNTMQREANAQQNLLSFYGVFLEASSVAPSMPWVRWMNVLRDLAEAFNVPDKADEWMIPEIFGAFGQPPQFPPSAVIGARGLPARAGPAGGQRRLPAGTIGQGPQDGGFESPNLINAAGRAQGPRPESVRGRGGRGLMGVS